MKKKGKNRLRRALAVFMTVFLLMGMMPQAALADTIVDDGGVVAEEQQPQSGEQQAGEEPPGTTAGDAELPDETDGGLVDVSANQIQAEAGGQQDSDLMRQAAADAALLGSDGSSETEHETVGGTVYLSVSYDGKYINGQNGAPIAYVPVSLSDVASVDLEEYELGDYLYDEDQDGTYDITALQLVIYAHERIYGGSWSDVTFTGGAGSSYFQGGIFGFDENLNYYLNGEYPLIGEGWGATSDQIVLEAGDFLDIASFSSWDFYADSNYGFHFFADESGAFTHNYTAEAKTEMPVKLVRSYSGMGSGAAVYDEAGYTIYYGTSYDNADAETVTTDDIGCASITFDEAGTYYLWCDGGYGSEFPDSIVSSPAYAIVTVTEANGGTGEQVNPDQEATDEAAATGVETLIGLIGTVTVHSGEKIKDAREAYDALTDAQKALVENYGVLTAAESEVKKLYEEAAKADHEKIYQKTGSYIAGLGTPSVGSTGGEWMVIDITRSGGVCLEGYYDNVVAYVKENINDSEQLHRSKSTDNSRVILGLTAAGYDVTDVDGHNLLMGLTDMAYVKKQGINGPIWALIAFDSYDYEIPEGGDVTREGLIEYILENRVDDGGWNLVLSSKVSDPDMTGMAIQALAPYYNTNAEVKAAVDGALKTLSDLQLENGGFGSMEGTCSESCAQVIVALTALGINPETDSRFIKNGMSVVDAMCLFAVESGGFAHVPNGGLNGMATEQSQYALAAYYRFLEGKTSLYDMTDVKIGDNPAAEIPAGDDEPSAGETTGSTSSGNASGTTANLRTGTTAGSVNIGLEANLTEEARAVIDQIDTFVTDVAAALPDEPADYTEEQMGSIIDAYKAYMALSDEEKLAVEESEAYQEFIGILEKIADFHHYDKESGVDMRENGEDVLPWHIRTVIEPKEMTKQQAADVNAALGEDSKVFTMNDIYFINVLDGEEWHPEDIVTVKKPMVNLEDYKHAVIVHIMDDGGIELLEGTVDGDTVSFNASSFSLYGIAGTNTDIFGAAEEDRAMAWPWILAGIVALAVFGYLMHRRIRQRSAS